jgi:hypothetical protein
MTWDYRRAKRVHELSGRVWHSYRSIVRLFSSDGADTTFTFVAIEARLREASMAVQCLPARYSRQCGRVKHSSPFLYRIVRIVPKLQ